MNTHTSSEVGRKANLDATIAIILDMVRAGAVGFDESRGHLYHKQVAGRPALHAADREIVSAIATRGCRVPHVTTVARAIEVAEAPLRAVHPVRISGQNNRNVSHESIV